MSFRFYDQILLFIKENVSRKEKDYYGMKYELKMKRIIDDDNLKKKLFQVFNLEKYV